tara:strand:+ start:1471 stop:2052 length:582 start_codon:yes stop_codon:yes gene_type:complete
MLNDEVLTNELGISTESTIPELSLYSGYGGFSLALKLAGLNTRTVCYVEWEDYAIQILRARIADEPSSLDDAPIWSDSGTFDGRPWAGRVGLISAGFPCQPFSNAGNREGEFDSSGRNRWPDVRRLVGEIRPRFLVLENVPGLLNPAGGRPPYAGTVVGELGEIGYRVEWRLVSASSAGAPHRRNRFWCLAYA